MNAPMPPLLHLPPIEAAVVPLLDAFDADHPGVTVLKPSYQNERWRAVIEAGANPADPREAILTARLPSELLAKLTAEISSG